MAQINDSEQQRDSSRLHLCYIYQSISQYGQIQFDIHTKVKYQTNNLQYQAGIHFPDIITVWQGYSIKIQRVQLEKISSSSGPEHPNI